MSEIDYCKGCEYYHPENEVYDCHCQEPLSTDNAWGFAKSRVLNPATCHKFYDEVRAISEEQADEYIMPFGKFKGVRLKDIDYKYIHWLNRQEWLKRPLRSYIEAYCHYYYIASCNVSSDISCDPYDVCPFSGYNEMGYGDLC